jgi:small subunit ribosomal protein S17
MAEEEKTEKQNEEAPETAAEETPEADAPEQSPDAEEQAPSDAPVESDGAPEVETPAVADASEASDDTGGGGEDASPEEGLDWKTRRRLERSRRPAESRPQQSPTERAAARAERRAQARKVRGSYRRKRREKSEAGTGTPPAERRSVARKMRQGTVVSDKADKTITVRIDVARRHPVYEKIVRSSNTLHAHDERNEANEGDLVRIVETRPISRSKRWRLVEVLEKAM